MAKEQPLVLEFPFGGLSEANAFLRQAGTKNAPTSADLLNVRAYDPRTGRRRGATRLGISKYLSTQINSGASIQCLDHVIGAGLKPSASIGHTVTGGASGAFRVVDTAGSITVTDATASATYLMSCWDNDGNCYVVWKDASEIVYVRKVNSAGTQAWQITAFTLDTGGVIVGLTELDSILYMWAYDVVGQTNNTSVLYRFDTDDGGATSANPWKTENASEIIARGTGYAAVAVHNLLAGTAGTLALLGTVSTTSTLQILNASTGQESVKVTLTAMTEEADLSSDDAGNYYAVYSDQTTHKVSKITAAGTTVWTKTSANAGGICSASYDPVGIRVFICGAHVSGVASANHSFATLNASTGAVVASSDMGSVTDWDYVRADGLGGCVLGNLNAGDDRLLGVSSALAQSWTLTSSSLLLTNLSVNNRDPDNSANRYVRALAVADGTVKVYDRDGTTTVTSGTAALHPGTPVIFSAPAGNGNLYFADGVSQKYYNGSANAMTAWTPTAGDFPTDSAGNKPRGIVNWRGRLVLWGLPLDPQNWFMTALNDPLDFDYEPAAISATMAVAGNNSETGVVGDVVNSCIPCATDVLIFGCDHTIWQLTGDPASGGFIDLLTDSIGMAFGLPWCKDSLGATWFFGSRGGVYRMGGDGGCGGKPERMSQAIEERLAEVNLSTTIVRMAWDDRQQGLHLWLTPLVSTTAATHYFFDARLQGWYADRYQDNDHNPKAVHVFDGDSPNDRVIMIGSWDGYVRFLDDAATDDDGEDIRSHVVFGPIAGRDLDEIMLKDLHAVLADDSNGLDWEVLTGRTPQAALTSTALMSGSWLAGRNPSTLVRLAAPGLYVKVSALETWALEALTAHIQETGAVRARAG